MDVFSFINSRDIRDYLKQIEYRFNSLEVAWLIWQCRSMSYEDKKGAWQEVINTMTDCKVESRANVKGWDSLHSMLRQYISEMDRDMSNQDMSDTVFEQVTEDNQITVQELQMFCTTCGEQIERTAKFCNFCGAKVTYIAKEEKQI